MREENAASGAEPPLTNASPAKPPPMTCAQKRQWEGWQRRLQRHQAVMEQHRRGVPIKQICRDSAISRRLVRRWVRGAIPELQRPRLDCLEAHREFLESRWAEGCRNAARLWRELRETGWRGSQRVVGEWAARQRLAMPARRTCHPANAPFAIPSVRRTARMLASELEKLAPSERRFIGQLLAASPQIARRVTWLYGLLPLSVHMPPTSSSRGWWRPRTASSDSLPSASNRMPLPFTPR